MTRLPSRPWPSPAMRRGHAVQHARGYAAMKVRSALVPIANFGSSVWLILLLIGIFLNMMQLFWLGIIFYAFAVLFQIVTLPVEFDASRRALAYVTGSSSGAVTASTRSAGHSGRCHGRWCPYGSQGGGTHRRGCGSHERSAAPVLPRHGTWRLAVCVFMSHPTRIMTAQM